MRNYQSLSNFNINWNFFSSWYFFLFLWWVPLWIRIVQILVETKCISPVIQYWKWSKSFAANPVGNSRFPGIIVDYSCRLLYILMNLGWLGMIATSWLSHFHKILFTVYHYFHKLILSDGCFSNIVLYQKLFFQKKWKVMIGII